MARQKFTPEQWEWIAARYQERYTQQELADFLGVHRRTVSEHLEKSGNSKTTRPSLTERKEEFLLLGEKKLV